MTTWLVGARKLLLLATAVSIALVILSSFSACQKDEPVKSLNIDLGQVVPVLPVLDFDGKSINLQFSGKRVTILNIWATWCGPCRHEMPSLQRLSQLLPADKFQVIGISVDDDSHIAREYLRDKNITFKNYINPDRRIADEILAIRAYPTTFVIDRGGKVRLIEEVWRYWDQPDIVKTIKDNGA
ncbi:MAG: TlpA family protein disulfide reductase, partial [Thiohalomonadales bacterium]